MFLGMKLDKEKSFWLILKVSFLVTTSFDSSPWDFHWYNCYVYRFRLK